MAEPRKVFDIMEGPSGRVPPQAVDYEMAVLAAILFDYKQALPVVLDTLRQEDFYKSGHQMMFAAMKELYDNGDPVDVLTVVDRLRKNGKLEKAGGEVYVAEVSMKNMSSQTVQYLSLVVYEKALARKLIATTSDLNRRAYSDQEDILELVEEAEKAVYALSEFRVKQRAQKMSVLTNTTVDALQAVHGNDSGIIGVASGFKDLDALTGGFWDGHLVIIAGRPSQGKSAFVANVATNAAGQGVKVGFFSLEMSATELLMRAIAGEGRVNAHNLRTGRLNDSDWNKVTAGAGRLFPLPIWIDDTPNLSVSDIRAKARRLRHEEGIQIVIVDYLQLMRGVGNEKSREQEISAISRGLKALAKELKIPVLALSQLNRGVESRADKRPVLADLRESGAIEQDADAVIFIHRPEMYGQKKIGNDSAEGVAEIIIAKQRMGPTGMPRLAFIKEYAKFENLTRQQQSTPSQATPVEDEPQDLPF